MTTLLISDFKSKCIEVLDAVHDTGQAVVVTRRGKPLVKIMPLNDPQPALRKLGGLARQAIEHGDIVYGGFAPE